MKRMKHRMLIFIIIVISIGSFVCGYQHENTIKRSFSINPGGTVRLKAIRGDINLSTHNGNEVKIEAIVFADESTELDKMKIEFETAADSVMIYTPTDTISVKADIDYYLKVPENLKTLQISTLSGDIESRGTYKNLTVTAINGDIDINAEFSGCTLTSVNGDIDVYLKDTLSGDIFIKSTNGSIEMTLKPDSDFTVEGNTVTGTIRSEFNTGITSDLTGTRIKGTINDGTHKLNLDTVNGDIRLLKE